MSDFHVGLAGRCTRRRQLLHCSFGNAVGDVRVSLDDFGVDVSYPPTDDSFGDPLS